MPLTRYELKINYADIKTWKEFLQIIFSYLLVQAFNWIDSDGDHIITKSEYTSPQVEKVNESRL